MLNNNNNCKNKFIDFNIIFQKEEIMRQPITHSISISTSTSTSISTCATQKELELCTNNFIIENSNLIDQIQKEIEMEKEEIKQIIEIKEQQQQQQQHEIYKEKEETNLEAFRCFQNDPTQNFVSLSNICLLMSQQVTNWFTITQVNETLINFVIKTSLEIGLFKADEGIPSTFSQQQFQLLLNEFINQVFQNCDFDHDGSISRDDLFQYIRQFYGTWYAWLFKKKLFKLFDQLTLCLGKSKQQPFLSQNDFKQLIIKMAKNQIRLNELVKIPQFCKFF
eukprot:TRINITY_DN595_c1_g1_i1.p1 TRINITY_DN595_c1_g1~~TRINITY_DN595_c1_g1_i1.p1  ORF type:complete len:279 (-),score=128.31 TRINITY_DN595_c1_g1_i1:40-876(-)